MWGNSDMSDRYAHDWATRSRDTKRSRQDDGGSVQCSYCGNWYHWDDIEVHHSSYQGENDEAGINIFPVCGSKQDVGSCHHQLHFEGNWIKDKWDPVWGNHNSKLVVRQLQRGYATGNPRIFDILSVRWDRIICTIGIIAIGWILMSALLSNKPQQQRTAIVLRPVNIRNGPSVAAAKVGVLPRGRSVVVKEKRSGWFKVGEGQWVAGNYLEEGKK